MRSYAGKQFVCLTIAAAVLAGVGKAHAGVAVQGQPATLVPPAQSAPPDRIGVYHWGADVAAWPGTPDRLKNLKAVSYRGSGLAL